ncbi:putative ring finger protein [Halotydeus destructor]|nr:putative ring finger protein [Halotydeus destructor]
MDAKLDFDEIMRADRGLPPTTPGYGVEYVPVYVDYVILVIVATIGGQVGLVWWRTQHPKNFQLVSMFGLWLFPLIRSVYYRGFIFVGLWTFLTLTTILLFFKPHGVRPRIIYKWFYWIYTLSWMLAPVGFGILVFDFMVRPKIRLLLTVGHVFFFYGLYCGVLARDFGDYLLEKVSHRHAAEVQEQCRTDPGVCAICGRHHGDAFVTSEKTLKLTCGHEFHEYCIYGWSLIGKKDNCPYCKERVDMGLILSRSYLQRPAYVYNKFLILIRYVILWFPFSFSPLTSSTISWVA